MPRRVDAERRTGIEYAKGSIDLTKQYGGKYVVVHLGGGGSAMLGPSVLSMWAI